MDIRVRLILLAINIIGASTCTIGLFVQYARQERLSRRAMLIMVSSTVAILSGLISLSLYP